MKSLFLIGAALAGVLCSACAHEQHAGYQHSQADEVVAFQAPLEMTTAMQGGVPIVTATIYTGITSMPEVVVKNASTAQMSTVKFAPFVALDGSQQSDKFLQSVTVINRDTTGSICLYLESWSQTCASSVAFTCEGATLQGMTTPAGASRTFRVAGTNQICANASEANVDGELERSIYFAK